MTVSHPVGGATPGPWHVVGRDPTPENVRFGYWDVDGKSNVASSCTYHDARLIAAAPDYAAVAPDAADLLSRYADFIRQSVKADELERHPYLPEIERVVEDLRAAIAKATQSTEGQNNER